MKDYIGYVWSIIPLAAFFTLDRPGEYYLMWGAIGGAAITGIAQIVVALINRKK